MAEGADEVEKAPLYPIYESGKVGFAGNAGFWAVAAAEDGAKGFKISLVGLELNTIDKVSKVESGLLKRGLLVVFMAKGPDPVKLKLGVAEEGVVVVVVVAGSRFGFSVKMGLAAGFGLGSEVRFEKKPVLLAFHMAELLKLVLLKGSWSLSKGFAAKDSELASCLRSNPIGDLV